MTVLLDAITTDHLVGFFLGACSGITIFSIVCGLAELSTQRAVREVLERHQKFLAGMAEEPSAGPVSRKFRS